MIQIQVHICQYDDCDQPATTLVATDNSWKPTIKALCIKHANEVQEQMEPHFDHIITCPNCWCEFGVK